MGGHLKMLFAQGKGWLGSKTQDMRIIKGKYKYPQLQQDLSKTILTANSGLKDLELFRESPHWDSPMRDVRPCKGRGILRRSRDTGAAAGLLSSRLLMPLVCRTSSA